MLSDPHACSVLTADLAGGQRTVFCASLLRMMHLKAVPLRPMDHTLVLSTFVPTEHSSPFKRSIICRYNSECRDSLCISAFFMQRLIANLYCQTFFREKEAVCF